MVCWGLFVLFESKKKEKAKTKKTQKADVTFLDSTQRKMKMNIPWKALVMVNK